MSGPKKFAASAWKGGWKSQLWTSEKEFLEVIAFDISLERWIRSELVTIRIGKSTSGKLKGWNSRKAHREV